MKIHGIGNQTVVRTEIQKCTTGTIDFQDLLRSQLEKIDHPKQASHIGASEPLTSPPPAVRVEGLAITEASLNTLEAYGVALGNNHLDTKTLEPFINTLEEEISALIAVRNQLPDQDPLTSVLDRVATLAFLETTKYHRGDYAA